MPLSVVTGLACIISGVALLAVWRVHYTASQDISALRDHLPDTPDRLGGMANMKYAAQNPANSILVCEEWSGLRAAPQAASASFTSANGTALADSNGIRHQTQDST